MPGLGNIVAVDLAAGIAVVLEALAGELTLWFVVIDEFHDAGKLFGKGWGVFTEINQYVPMRGCLILKANTDGGWIFLVGLIHGMG